MTEVVCGALDRGVNRMAQGLPEFSDWGRVEIAAAAILVALAGLLLLGVLQGRGLRLPPGPRGWPLLGVLPYVGDFPHVSFFEMSQKYGPVMFLRLGAVSALVVSDANTAQEVLQTKDLVFASPPALLVVKELTNNLQDIAFAPYGPHWRRVRKIATLQLLTISKLNHFMGNLKDEIMNGIHIVLEQSQSSGKNDINVKMGALFNGMSMNVVTRMMWNRRHRNIKGSQSHRDQKFEDLTRKVMELGGVNNIADFLPPFLQSLSMKLTGLAKQTKVIHTDLDEFCESIICEKEEALSKEATVAADEDDFVDVMLKLMNQPQDSEGLSRDSMKGILTDMIIAGSDTTSITLDWIFAELIRHPNMIKRVQDELEKVVGGERLVNESDIPNLKYLNAVVKEVFRIHTVAPLALHYAREDAKVGGYDVPANTWVFVSLFAIHHDPKAWERPWEFDPDRFLKSDVDYKGRNFEFIPFGTGRRMCPAVNLASTFVHLTVAQFFHCASWSLPEGQKPEDLDMKEASGLVLGRATPLLLNAKPKLAHHIIYPNVA